MKKLFVMGLFLITILAMAVSVAADVTLSVSSLSTSATKPTGDFSVSFTVTNNDNVSGLSNINLGQTGLSDFGINFTIAGVPVTSFNLAASEPKTVTVNGEIPEDVNARLSPFTGTITLSGPVTESLPLSVNVEGQLKLDKLKVKVDGKSETLDDGDKIDDAKPGSKIEFIGDVENIFSDDDDIDIEDVEITITIDDIDDGDELEETDELGDIKADDKESFTLEFDISDDVEDGDYDVVVLLEGEDENGAKYSVEWDLTLELSKDKHDIWITRASVSPSKVGCSRNINVNVDLKNQGRSDEDEVVVIIESSALDIDYEDTSIPELEEGYDDSDTETSERYPFTISDKVKAGTYQIIVKAYYDTDTLSDTETIDLKVEACADEAEEEPEDEEEEVIVVTPPLDEEEEGEDLDILTTPVTETTEVSLLGSNTYMLFLFGAVGVAVIVIIIMVAVLFSIKKKQRQE